MEMQIEDQNQLENNLVFSSFNHFWGGLASPDVLLYELQTIYFTRVEKLLRVLISINIETPNLFNHYR